MTGNRGPSRQVEGSGESEAPAAHLGIRASLHFLMQRLQELPRLLLLALLVAFVLLALRVATTGAPVMGVDEYAYFGTAKYGGDVGHIHEFDPWMQPVDNRVYPLLYSAWAAVSPHDTALVGRLFQSLVFVLGAVLLFFTFRRVFDRRAALYSSILYLALPLSFYATLLLPEVELQVFVYLSALVVAVSGTAPRYRHVLATAVLGAVAYFIKPHAAALILACMVYWFATGLVGGVGALPRRLGIASLRALGYAVPVILIIVAVNRFADAGPATGAIVPSFYRSYLDQFLSPEFLVPGVGGFFDYGFGHLWVLLALFAPGIYFVVRTGGGTLIAALRPGPRSHSLDRDRSALFALFVLMLLAAFLGMIAVFTVSATGVNEFEKYRLHGRYLAPVLPLLLGCSVWASGHMRQRLAPVLGIVALVTLVFVGRGRYKIFPWDYPEIFGLFGKGIHYWGFEGVLSWTVWLILLSGVVAYAMQLRGLRSRAWYIVFVTTWAIASHLQMTRWLDFHVEANRATVAAADAIEAYLGSTPAGSGLVVTFDRYGEAPFLLMGFDHLQHVKALTKDQAVTDVDIPPGATWVVAPRDAVVDLPGFETHAFGTQIVYRRGISPSSP